MVPCSCLSSPGSVSELGASSSSWPTLRGWRREVKEDFMVKKEECGREDRLM